MKHDVCRFGELQRLIPDCSKRMLALQLNELEDDNIINKTVYPVMPPKTEYQLSEFGKHLFQ
jgi:DNA-binding HxlR family transcriptional regulator